MHLVYLDESGNTGNNLADPEQPLFVLCAMVVPEGNWIALEQELEQVIHAQFPQGAPKDFEVHSGDLRMGRGFFTGMPVPQRIAFRDKWLAIAPRHNVKVIYRAIQKKRYGSWLEQTFGAGVAINPHVVAFSLVAKVVNDYLRSLPGKPLGIFISDENREITVDVEKSIKLLRGSVSSIGLGQFVEKGFFIDSHKSLPLQLCDVFALNLRKHEEVLQGLRPAKPFDEAAFALIEPLLHRGDEAFVDVIAWLTEEEKKKRPETKV